MRVTLIVEGQTEEQFVKHVLGCYFRQLGIEVCPRLLESRQGSPRLHKGGWNSYASAKRQIQRTMREDRGAWCTTMLDFYALPDDFPKKEEAQKIKDPYERVAFLERAFLEDIKDDRHWQFLPYIQLHEFETLILADPQQLEHEFPNHADPITELVRIVSQYDTPELINGTPEGAPSKRIIACIPQYRARKTTAGPFIADKIGFPTLRARCPHFNTWIQTLEKLAQP